VTEESKEMPIASLKTTNKALVVNPLKMPFNKPNARSSTKNNIIEKSSNMLNNGRIIMGGVGIGKNSHLINGL
jgi:hypothetical protein